MVYKLSKDGKRMATAETLFDLHAATKDMGAWQIINPDAIQKPGAVNLTDEQGEWGIVPGYAVEII